VAETRQHMRPGLSSIPKAYLKPVQSQLLVLKVENQRREIEQPISLAFQSSTIGGTRGIGKSGPNLRQDSDSFRTFALVAVCH